MNICLKICLIIEIVGFSSGILMMILGFAIDEDDVIDAGGIITIIAVILAIAAFVIVRAVALIQDILS